MQNDKSGLHELSLSGEDYKHVYTHKNVDITNTVKTTDGRGVYAIRIDDGYPSYLIFPNPGEEGETFKELLNQFSGSLVSIRSRSRDGRFWVIETETDIDPGSFYLLDREENSIIKLFDSKPDVKQQELLSVEPIKFESFDGKSIPGYFTTAAGSEEDTAPLVVLVHGGPIARDYWGYNETVQALATNGFSVLQINYRGSAGYGESYEQAGYLQWGDEIQRDIIAGARWAIKEQRVKAGKICIMGGSFGAYSAVKSATLAPDLFACVVANAGIYDLSLMYKKGDIEQFYGGDEYLEKVIGRDKDQLANFSPVNRIADLRAPILVAHGKQDERAPFAHAKRLRKALKKHGKEYEWFVKSREAHGFYNNENQVEYL
jgi:dipeptidyl aminopeptidase/acylaminoacyl peptidase